MDSRLRDLFQAGGPWASYLITLSVVSFSLKWADSSTSTERCCEDSVSSSFSRGTSTQTPSVTDSPCHLLPSNSDGGVLIAPPTPNQKEGRHTEGAQYYLLNL